MGKVKPNRRRNKGEGPTGLPSVKDIVKEEEIEGENASAARASDLVIQNIIDELQGSPEEKMYALHTLDSIFQSAGTVEEAVRQKVARIAGPLLLDLSSPVRNAAAGALRILTSSSNHEVIDLLVEQDIMTPLTAFFHKYAENFQHPGDPKSEDTDTFVEAVYLLWNLCEGSNTAVQNLNERNLLPVLMKYISAAPENLNITLAIVHCLITIVDGNTSACNFLQKSESELNNLLGLKGENSGLLLLRVLTAGVLLKINTDQNNVLPPILLDVIVAPLLQDNNEKLNELKNIDSKSLVNDHVLLQEIYHLLEAQQVSLELLTNLCADGEEEDMDIDSNSISSIDDICEINDASEMEPSSLEHNLTSSSLMPEIHEVIVSRQLIQHIWKKSKELDKSVSRLLHEHFGGQHLLKRMIILRERAFLCLNNLIPALDVQDFEGNLLSMWAEMVLVVFQQLECDPEVVEAASAAMRAALEKFSQNVSAEPVKIASTDIKLMLSAPPNPNSNVRANIFRTFCVLGMINLPQCSKENIHNLQCVGKFLLDACAHETELWVLAEALDCIMDLFGEDETDQVASDLGLVDHLQSLLPNFKHKVQVNRKKLGDHYALVSTVNSNLPRFIKYKKKRLSLL